MRRTSWIAAGLLCAACGSGGGGGSDVSEGPAFWGVPFVPSSANRDLLVGLHNLDTGPATATLQGYRPNGTPYTGPVVVNLDRGEDVILSASDACGGDAAAGGWIEIQTPSRRVQAYFDVQNGQGDAAEASRAVPLPDLFAPPLSTSGSIAVLPDAGTFQISNASPLVNAITLTPYEEPADPALPPVQGAPIALPPFAPFESRTFDAFTITGVPGFQGSFALQGPQPFFAATEFDLSGIALSVQTWSDLESAKEPVAGIASVRHGPEPTNFGVNLFDFGLSALNATGQTTSVTVSAVRLEDGTAVKTIPRTVSLAPFEFRFFSTTDPLFDDLFGDPFLAASLRNAWIQISASAGVDASFFEIDAQFGGFLSHVRPTPIGHVFAGFPVVPQPFPDGEFRTVFHVTNPGSLPLTVNVQALAPVEDGDPQQIVLPSIVIPPGGQARVSPDGVPLLSDIPLVSFLFTSNGPFSATGRAERRAASELLIFVTPRIVIQSE